MPKDKELCRAVCFGTKGEVRLLLLKGCKIESKEEEG